MQKQIRADLGRGDDASADARAAMIHQYADQRDYHDALSWTAYEYRKAGRYSRAIEMYQQLYALNPDPKVKLRCDEGIARAYVRLGQDDKVQEQLDRIYAEYYTDNPTGVAFYVLGIAEAYYWDAQQTASRGDPTEAKAAYQKGLEIVEYAIPTMPDAHYRSNAFYLKGLIYRLLENPYESADAFMNSLEANRRHQYADAMCWLIADGYEKLKQAGEVEAETADAVALWAYVTFFEQYPDSPMVSYAAMQLARLHVEQKRPVAATAYLYWLMDYEAVKGYQYTSPQADIDTLLKNIGGCR